MSKILTSEVKGNIDNLVASGKSCKEISKELGIRYQIVYSYISKKKTPEKTLE